jgi:hypothetical protein
LKKPFRFFRGELNGYYILALLLSKNDAANDILDELIYQATFRWKLPSEITGNEAPIREEDLLGIAKFAGVDRPVQYLKSTQGSERLTESHIVSGKERSERGLYDPISDSIVFLHVDSDDYVDDIVTQASANARMGLVPHGQAVVGYVAYGTTLFDSSGNIIPGALLASPPGGGTPYTEYYGTSFLFLEETFNTDIDMDIAMFKAYFEHVQKMRLGTGAIAELLDMTMLLCSDYLVNLELVPSGYSYILYYSLAPSSVDNKEGRIATWQRIISKRFKDITTVERPL